MMNALITGTSTPLGSLVLEKLFQEKYNIISLSPSGNDSSTIQKEVSQCIDGLEVDLLLLLHSSNIFQKRFSTPLLKKEAEKSLLIHKQVIDHLLNCRTLPQNVFIESSAFAYMDLQEKSLAESSRFNEDFCGRFFREVEKNGQRLSERKVRTVLLRPAQIISHQLDPLRPLSFLGKRLLLSSQQVRNISHSWLSLEDAAEAIHFLLKNETISGPVNLARENELSFEHFLKLLSPILSYGSVHFLPERLLELLRSSDSLSLSGPTGNISTEKLLSAGFRYSSPTLAEYLEPPD